MTDYETKDYKVIEFKRGDWVDNFGNYWCDMALEGVSEPVRIAVKDPTQFESGQVLYGTIEHGNSKAGKPYLKFKRLKKEDGNAGTETKREWQPESPERQDSINRSVALNNAAVIYQGSGVEPGDVTKTADVFYAWLKGPIAAVDDAFGTSEPINMDDVPY